MIKRLFHITESVTRYSFALLSVAAMMFSGCGQSDQRPLSGVSPMVRILLGETKEAEIRTSGNWFLSVDTRKGMGSRTVTLTRTATGISVNDVEIPGTNSIEISTPDGFTWNGRKFRGDVRILPVKEGLYVINLIDIESYLYGVLPGEVSPLWHKEALKAQAVVSRTYALYDIGLSRKSARPFDLYSDTRSQVYNGLDSESRFTSFAVDNTVGEALRYDGKIIQAFFHASSGGMTESSEAVFGTSYPYLTPVASPFCESWKDNRWELTLPSSETFILPGVSVSNPLVSVSVRSRTSSKRIDALEYVLSNGETNSISGKELRSLVGATKMKSTRVNILLTNGELKFFGAGYGHGVGMGQWDAQGMAVRNYNYRAILAYFYPGSSLDRIW